MYSLPVTVIRFLRYWLTASSGKGHGVHSPFVYTFIRDVLMDRAHHEAYVKPEAYRNSLLRNRTRLELRDLGAGSHAGGTGRRVCDIADTSVKHKRYSSLLYRTGRYLGSRHILELGTSLGVTTLYLAGIPTGERVVTLEGSAAVADVAAAAFRKAGYDRVQLVRGDFDDTLGDVLESLGRVDLVFVDGNHRKEPTLRYFRQILPYLGNESCIVFDDIHWSRDMEEAWDEIRKDPRVRVSIDLFAIGIVFFRREFLEKQDYRIRYGFPGT
jgi:predicted O-methyltransferase YrrM